MGLQRQERQDVYKRQRIEGKNANDFVAELEQKGNEANKAALEAAKEAYAMIGIELNY